MVAPHSTMTIEVTSNDSVRPIVKVVREAELERLSWGFVNRGNGAASCINGKHFYCIL